MGKSRVNGDGEEMVNTAVSLPKPLLEWIDDYKRRRVIGRSLIVERALIEYRDRHDSESKDKPPRSFNLTGEKE